MVATTGELIRLINYVDDIVTTIRRVSASVPMMDSDERRRLAERVRDARTQFDNLIGEIEKGAK